MQFVPESTLCSSVTELKAPYSIFFLFCQEALYIHLSLIELHEWSSHRSTINLLQND